jgi:hypothetical protein
MERPQKPSLRMLIIPANKQIARFLNTGLLVRQMYGSYAKKRSENTILHFITVNSF